MCLLCTSSELGQALSSWVYAVQAQQDPDASMHAVLYTALAPLQDDVGDSVPDEQLLQPEAVEAVWASSRVQCVLWQLCYTPLSGPGWELLAGVGQVTLPQALVPALRATARAV